MKNIFKGTIIVLAGIFVGYKFHEWINEITVTEEDIEKIVEDLSKD